jgi:hypothetical protein
LLSYQPHLEVEVGDGSLPVAVEIALRKMKERQEGIISVFSNEFLSAGSHLQHGLVRNSDNQSTCVTFHALCPLCLLDRVSVSLRCSLLCSYRDFGA